MPEIHKVTFESPAYYQIKVSGNISHDLRETPRAFADDITIDDKSLNADISFFSKDQAQLTGIGIGLQFNASYSFTKRLFLFINPTPLFLNVDSNWKAYWSGELNLNYVFVPNKIKANIYWGPNFTNEVHVIRVGTTFYL